MQKTALITGATAGIGKETAIALAKQGFEVYIVGRTEAKCAQAVADIKALSNNTNVGFFTADLADQTHVRKLAEEVKARLPKLNVLVNNAGAVYNKLELSPQGIEMQFATNHLAPFLLTNLLKDLLIQNAPARVVTVSSHAHYYCKHINFDNLYFDPDYDGLKAYAQSKLGNVLFTMQMAELLKGTGVTVNCLHPGFVKTDIGNKHGGWFYRMFWSISAAIMAISVQKGAETSIYLASSPAVEGKTGMYFAKSAHKWQSRYSQTEGLKEKMWDVSAKLTGL